MNFHLNYIGYLFKITNLPDWFCAFASLKMFVSKMNNLLTQEEDPVILLAGEELGDAILDDCKEYFERKMLDQKYFIRSDTVFWRRPGKFIRIFKDANPVRRNAAHGQVDIGDDAEMEEGGNEGVNFGPQPVLGLVGPVPAARRIVYVVDAPARVFESSNLSSYTPSNWTNWVTIINSKRNMIANVIQRYFINSPQLHPMYLWRDGIGNPELKPPNWQLQILLTSLILSEIQPMMPTYGYMEVFSDATHRRTLDSYFTTIFIHFLSCMGLLTLRPEFRHTGRSRDWKKKLENHHISANFAPFFLLNGDTDALNSQYERASIRINNEESLPEYICRIYKIHASLTQNVLDGPRQANGRRTNANWRLP